MPAKPRPLKVATPLDAATGVVVPVRVPPAPTTATATDAAELVTVLPAESRTLTFGWIVSGAPEAPACGKGSTRANPSGTPGLVGEIGSLSSSTPGNKLVVKRSL